ncbi:sensor histidine kinase [Pseudoduganella chitinolytica]|uniref:Histidine kinase n=1 Tax=Pseudoduganella chitinolytica TaxID=34070 RepID=A0ABY8BAP8_9BURK|nr:histidine kinase [Pseudoduganella chitinolytica]WEF32987.1 histidine kinase [Pseudoduganella chitinolytica]
MTNAPAPGTNAARALLYCAAMNRPPSLPVWLRALLVNFGLWTGLCALAGMTTYSDAAHDGDPRGYVEMTLGWWYGYLAMMVQSWLLYLLYRGRPGWLATPARIAAGYAVYIAACAPFALLGLALRRCFKFGMAPTLTNVLHYCAAMDKFEWFVVFVLLTLAFGTVVASLLWRQRRRQDAELARARLSLERQRLAALRGQLEPHFIFNTLSAIGAVVRTDDKPVALDGLERLGNLLHYALSNSTRDWIHMTQELAFVHHYLDLQRLRFGDRLRVRIDGVDLLDDGIECPPMLLQPLVENALRHDLECHDEASDIAVTFVREGTRLLVRVTNPVRAHAAPQAGLGIGLRGIRARLQLAYGDAATLVTAHVGGRFAAELSLPWNAAQ